MLFAERNFLNGPKLLTTTSLHKISGLQNITCSAQGRPIPTLTWKLANDMQLEGDRKNPIFTIHIVTDEKNLTITSTLSLINPISFGRSSRILCVAIGKDLNNLDLITNKSVLLNTG